MEGNGQMLRPSEAELEAAEQNLLPLAENLFAVLFKSGVPPESHGDLLNKALNLAAQKVISRDEDSLVDDFAKQPANVEQTSELIPKNEPSIPETSQQEVEKPGFEVPRYLIAGGEKQSFLIGGDEIPYWRQSETPGAPPKLVTGIMTVIKPLLDESTPFADPTTPPRILVGPDIFVTDVTRMRLGDAKALFKETIDEHTNQPGAGPSSFYMEHLMNAPFKVVLSGDEALEENDWQPETSCLLIGGDEMNAAYPYLIRNENPENGKAFDLKFADKPPQHVEGACLPLGTIALLQNMLTFAPFERASFVGSEEYPQFSMHSLQPKVEDLPDQVHEAFEEIRHWSGGWAVPIDKLKDKPLLQEKNEVVAIEEPVVEEMLPEPFRPSASVLGDRSRQPTPAKRGLGRHRNNNGPKTIDIGKT